ncbi:hypothetical protein BH20ACT7_BH20ACT7_10530 [soil metagenome]
MGGAVTIAAQQPSTTEAVAARPRPAWTLPLLAWLASRVLVVAGIAIGNRLQGTGQTVLDALHLWDGNWYLSAAAGYATPGAASGQSLPQLNFAFFPAYPLMIRAVSAVPGVSPLLAAVVLNVLLGGLAVMGIWELTRRLSGRQAADRAAALVAFFPGSVVLSLVYSEPLMLTFAAGCLLALLDRRWTLAGLLALAAGATRPNGIVLAACCAWAALAALRRDGDRTALIAPLLAPLGFVGYLGWLWARTGDPTIWFRVQRDGWGERIDFGRRTIAEISVLAPGGEALTPTILLQVLGLVFVVVASVLLWRWRPPAVVVVYTLGILAASLLSQTLGARPRFLLTAFPLVVAVAVVVRGWPYRLLLGVSAAGCAVLAGLYTVPLLAVP